MAFHSTVPRSLDRYIPQSEHGNRTSVSIDAAPAVVWDALQQVKLSDCRTSQLLLGIRLLPGRLFRHRTDHATRDSGRPEAGVPLLDSLISWRFSVLEEVPGEEIVLGVIGQFWRLRGGTDAPIAGGDEFVAFDQPGYVKAAINFRLEATSTGSLLTTETCTVATDAARARKFSVYWAFVGWGSKLIRRDMLAAVRRRAEAS